MEEAKTIEIEYIEHESYLHVYTDLLYISTTCQHCLLLKNMQAG